MRFLSQTAWSFVASLACLGVVDAADMLEVDLLFPRDNETYAPMERFPIVFGLRNAELGQYLQPTLDVALQNSTSEFWEDRSGIESMSSSVLTRADWSSHEPYFASMFVNAFTTETTWSLYWTVSWTRCKADGDGVFRGHTTWNESTRFLINFTIKNGGQAVDLVAATANGKACANDGFAIGVTDKVNVTNLLGLGSKPELETCMVMASSTPTPTADPCRVTIDSTAAASISAQRSQLLCYDTHPKLTDCPSQRKSAGPRLAVAGVACMTAAFWAFGFLLV